MGAVDTHTTAGVLTLSAKKGKRLMSAVGSILGGIDFKHNTSKKWQLFLTDVL